jgi:hypothetical protein
MPRDPMRPVLTVKAEAARSDMYILMSGDTFDDRRDFPMHKDQPAGPGDFVCGKHPTLVIRETTPRGVSYSKFAIHDASVWRWIAGLINDKDGVIAAALFPDQP